MQRMPVAATIIINIIPPLMDAIIMAVDSFDIPSPSWSVVD